MFSPADELACEKAIGISPNYETNLGSLQKLGSDEDPTVFTLNLFISVMVAKQ